MIEVEKDVFKSIVLDGNLRVDEGNDIEFIVETTGEVKQGLVTKICGNSKERKLQILPKESECEEVWSLESVKNGSLKILA